MDFLPSRGKKFKPRRRNICETKSAPSFSARLRTWAQRRPHNGLADGGRGHGRTSSVRGTNRDVAEAHQGAAFERIGSCARGSAFDSQISWRIVFPLWQRGGCRSRSGGGGNDRDRGSHG